MPELRDMLKSNPYSDEYLLPAGKTPKDLLRLMLARQKAVFGSTILDDGEFTYVILERNFKLLLKAYSLEELKRGVEIAIWRGDHPFSTKFVEECVIWLREIQACPISRALENST